MNVLTKFQHFVKQCIFHYAFVFRQVVAVSVSEKNVPRLEAMIVMYAQYVSEKGSSPNEWMLLLALSPAYFRVKDTMLTYFTRLVFLKRTFPHPQRAVPEMMMGWMAHCIRSEGTVTAPTLTASFYEFRSAMAVTHVVRYKYIFPSPRLGEPSLAKTKCVGGELAS